VMWERGVHGVVLTGNLPARTSDDIMELGSVHLVTIQQRPPVAPTSWHIQPSTSVAQFISFHVPEIFSKV
jgi:hypothetical protein